MGVYDTPHIVYFPILHTQLCVLVCAGQTGRKPFEDALSKLVRDGLEDKLTAALRANVERTQALYTRTHATDRTAGAAAGTSGAIAGAASQTTENVVQMWAGTSGNAAVVR